jgi:hypothetical protein
VAVRLTPESLRNSSEGKQINEGHTFQIGGSIGDRVRMVAWDGMKRGTRS